MSNIIEMLEQNTERTPEQSEALYMHEQLIIHKQMISVGLANLCRDLKEIRDRKLYIPLGYDDFGAYTEQEHGIKQRMAYNYIATYEKLGVEILQSNAKLGITKLLQIATLDREEREELLSEHSTDELADMSSEEVKRLTEQVKKLQEQISFLETEKANASMPKVVVQQPFDELEAEIREDVEAKLEAQFEEERNYFKQRIASLEMSAARTVSDDELKKYRENAVKEAKAEAKTEIQDIKAKLKAAQERAQKNEQIAGDLTKKLTEAQKAKQEADEKAQKAREFEEKLKAQEEANAALEKRIRAASDPEFERFKFLFEAWQKSTAELKAQLDKVGEDKRDKLKGAIQKVCEVNGL